MIREELVENLFHAGNRVRISTATRNDLIAQAWDEGASLKEIAQIAQVSPTTVFNIKERFSRSRR